MQHERGIQEPRGPTPESQGSSTREISARRYAEIDKELKELNTKSLVCAIPGLIIQAAGSLADNRLFTLTGFLLFIVGLVFYAKMRGRGPAWALLGLSSCLGILILYLLPKHCVNCRATHSSSTKRCGHCGAPLGA